MNDEPSIAEVATGREFRSIPQKNQEWKRFVPTNRDDRGRSQISRDARGKGRNRADLSSG